TRMLSWGTDTDLYRAPQELVERFPIGLGRAGQLVLKQSRGTAGNGVWRVEVVATSTDTASADAVGRIQHAQTRDASVETTTLGAFLERCSEYFPWSGSLISQPYQARLADGMIRCYFVHDKVVGFCHQWPTGLLDTSNLERDTSEGPVARHAA